MPSKQIIRGLEMRIGIASLLAAAAGLVISQSVFAADIPAKAPVYRAPPPAVYSWTGFYVGGNAGGAFGSFHPSTSSTFDPAGYFTGVGSLAALNAAGAQSIKPSGFTGGLEAGYNWQLGSSFVFGFEGDIEFFGLKGNATSTAAYPCCPPATLTVTSSASADWLATARLRLGVASNNWLFFATGGAAFTTLKANFAFSDNCGQVVGCNGPAGANGAEAASFSKTVAGYVVGGGVEIATWQNWTVKAEYLYVKFGTVSGTGIVPATGGGPQTLTHRFDLTANIVRGGVNYRF